MRPDLFGLVPNVLDPVFYTGYSINLDDVISASGADHYFVTRWPSYLPAHFFSWMFGPYWGRLALHLLMLVALAELLWRLLAQLKCSRVSRFLSVSIVLTTPMFVRAFTTEYPEYYLIWAGLLVLVLSFSSTRTTTRTFLIGSLVTSIMITNPTSSFLCLLVLVNYFVSLRSDRDVKPLRWHIVFLALSVLVVIGFGYFYFRIRYGLPNIYQPTIDYLKSYRPPTEDGWRTPDRAWLMYFGWIYLPIIFVLAAFFRLQNEKSQYTNTLWHCVVLSLATYGFHVLMETLSGHALETSYYWSQLLPPILLLFVLLVARAFHKASLSFVLVLLVVTLGTYGFQIPQKMRLPHDTGLFLSLLLFLLLLYLTRKHHLQFGLLLLLGTIWVQVGSPKYEELTPQGNLNSPRYDLVFRDKSKLSEQVLNEIVWFTSQMDHVPLDHRSVFATTDDWPYVITGTYLPHLYGRFLLMKPTNPVFPNDRLGEFQMGFSPVLIIYGPSPESSRVLDVVRSALPNMSLIRDVVNQSGRKYRFIALTSLPVP